MDKLPYFPDLVDKTLEYNYASSNGAGNESLAQYMKERQLYFFKNGFGAMVVSYKDGVFVSDSPIDVSVVEGNMQSWSVVMVSSIAVDARCYNEGELRSLLERIEALDEKN